MAQVSARYKEIISWKYYNRAFCAYNRVEPIIAVRKNGLLDIINADLIIIKLQWPAINRRDTYVRVCDGSRTKFGQWQYAVASKNNF